MVDLSAFRAITINFVTRRYLRFAGLANFGAANQLGNEDNRRTEDKRDHSLLTGAIFRGVANFQRLAGPRSLLLNRIRWRFRFRFVGFPATRNARAVQFD